MQPQLIDRTSRPFHIENTPASIRRVARCKAPGTCGELLQGAIDDCDFLVNCPVDLFSRASVFPTDKRGLELENAHAFHKILDAVDIVSRGYDIDPGCQMRVQSDIPRGKGMASSTADLTAAIKALCRSWDITLPDEHVAAVITTVEPSDCVHFPGIAHVNHLTGELIESLPVPNDLRVLVVDCGGEVDTLDFDRERARTVYRRNQPAMKAALELLRRGLHEKNDEYVARAATQSAWLSQQILPKAPFEEILARSVRLGALGVNCAHSGTVLGVLHRALDHLEDRLVNMVERHFGSAVEILGNFRIIGGGCHEAL